MNKVILIGRLGRDPETRHSQTGTTVCSFSLATSEKYKGEEKTEWHNITTFGKLAEICGEYLSKGKQIYIEGRIQTEEWEKDGVKRYTTKIIGDKMEMLGGREKPVEDDGPSPKNAVTDEDILF